MAQEILECPIESLRLSTKAHVAAIESFNETILHWFARLDELQSHTMFFAQSASVTENQFWSGEFFKIPAGRIGNATLPSTSRYSLMSAAMQFSVNCSELLFKQSVIT